MNWYIGRCPVTCSFHFKINYFFLSATFSFTKLHHPIVFFNCKVFHVIILQLIHPMQRSCVYQFSLLTIQLKIILECFELLEMIGVSVGGCIQQNKFKSKQKYTFWRCTQFFSLRLVFHIWLKYNKNWNLSSYTRTGKYLYIFFSISAINGNSF